MKQVALFGAGRIGGIHAANLAGLPGVQLKYISDPFAEAARRLAEKYGARADAHPDAIFQDPAVSAIIIGTPTTTHSALIQQAAAAGKHIFCEKPVDLSTARAQECAEAVAKAGVACMIGFQRRFDPSFSEAKRRLDDGEIGTPEMLVITSRDCAPPPIDYIRSSGGIFRDMLIHDFDVFRWILGDEAVWLSATGASLVDPAIGRAGDVDSVVVSLRTRSGRLCQINASRRAAYGYDQRFEVLGSAGLLACENLRPTAVCQMDARGVHLDKPEHFFLQRYREAYRLEIEHFFQQLETGASFRTGIADGVAAQRLADAAARSLASGQAVVFD
ncbi:inositol 2-dehydrogenase [Castellaniella hirudinis]|uniref:inositol 2-dehydrogenase n=1 Tax=Castellaniella hirudinis TaxID=1144617 RepID=UPI0039C3706F